MPEYHQKGDFTPAGTQVNNLKFPKLLSQRKQWILAIWSDEGKHFTITETTTVCLLHFSREDLHKSLNRSSTFERVQSLFRKYRSREAQIAKINT